MGALEGQVSAFELVGDVKREVVVTRTIHLKLLKKGIKEGIFKKVE